MADLKDSDGRVRRGRPTRDALMSGAQKLFSDFGFAAVSIERILEFTRISRGSLYHHFKTKEGLFRAVVESVCAEVASEVEAAAIQERDPKCRVRAGCLAWLECSKSAQVRQIIVVDAPTVLGWAEWRHLDDAHFLGGLRAGLAEVGGADGFASTLYLDLARMLVSALNEAAQSIADATTPEAEARAEQAALVLLDSIIDVISSSE